MSSPAEPWVRALAAAVLWRALKDARPRYYHNRRDTDKHRIKRQSALEWADADGEGFRFWCRAAGIAPRHVREAIDRVARGEDPKRLRLR